MKLRLFLLLAILVSHTRAAQTQPYTEQQLIELLRAAKRNTDRNLKQCKKELEAAQEIISCSEALSNRELYQTEHDILWIHFCNFTGRFKEGYTTLKHITRQQVSSLPSEWFVRYYEAKGDFFSKANRLDLTLECTQKSIPQAYKSKNDTLIARALYNNSMYHYLAFKRGIHSNITEVYEEAMLAQQFAQKAGDSMSLFLSNYLLGLLNLHYQEVAIAREHFDAMMQYGQGALDPVFYNNMASPYIQTLISMQLYDEALYYSKRSLDAALYTNNVCSALHAYSNIGTLLIDKQDTSGAYAYFEASRSLGASEATSVHPYYLYTAKLYLLTGDTIKAKTYLDDYTSIIDPELLVNEKKPHYYREIAELYTQMNDTKSAVVYYKLWGDTNDSLQRHTAQLNLQGIKKLYRVERAKNQEISQKNQALQQSNTQQAALGLILLLTLGIGGSWVYRIRMKAAHKNQALQGKQLEQLMEVQEGERQRLARELHDGVGQSLAALKMQLQMGTENEVSPHAIKRMEELCMEVRSMSHQMMPLILQENGLNDALEWLADEMFAHTNISVNLALNTGEERLSNEIETHLYRAAQELLNNVLRHANATAVGIQVLRPKDKFILLVEDNGCGIKKQDKFTGIGLANVKARITSIRGQLTISPNGDTGTVVRIVVPTQQSNRLTA